MTDLHLGAASVTITETCPKCGSPDLWARWCHPAVDCTDESFIDRKWTDTPPPNEREHLDRGCRNCQYRWYSPIAGGKP